MKGIVGAIITALVIGFLMIGGWACSETIPAGYAGIVYNLNGGIEDQVLDQGFKIVPPTKRIITYTIGLEQSFMTADKKGDSTDDESFEIPTKEGASLEVDVAYSYSFDRDRLPEIFKRFKGQDGKSILKSFIKPKMQAWIKEITPEFTMMQIVATQRGVVNNTITDKLKARFDEYGIIIDNIALADVRPDEDTARSITERIQAQEALEKEKVVAEKDKVEAQKDKEIAEINAEKDRIEAQGKADAKIIAAEAEAQANKLISESLTPELLENKRINKWKGEVPTVQGAGSTIVDTRKLTE